MRCFPSALTAVALTSVWRRGSCRPCVLGVPSAPCSPDRWAGFACCTWRWPPAIASLALRAAAVPARRSQLLWPRPQEQGQGDVSGPRAGESVSSGSGVRATEGRTASGSPFAHGDALPPRGSHGLGDSTSQGSSSWWRVPSWQKSRGPSRGRMATEPLSGHQGAHGAEAKCPGSELPGQMTSLTATTFFWRIRAAQCRAGIRPCHKQRPFLPQAGDFIMHSRLWEASGFRQAWHNGWESRGGRRERALAESQREDQVREGESHVLSPDCHAGHVRPRCAQNALCVRESAGAGAGFLSHLPREEAETGHRPSGAS